MLPYRDHSGGRVVADLDMTGNRQGILTPQTSWTEAPRSDKVKAVKVGGRGVLGRRIELMFPALSCGYS